MKTKIFFLIIATFLVNTAYSQKVFVPTLKKYAKLIEQYDDTQNDVSKYTGEYLLIYPGYDQNEISEGDAYLIQLGLSISKDGKTVFATQILQIPEKEAVKTTKLSNPTVFGNNFSSDEMSGKFVVLKFKDKDKNVFVKGIFKKHTKDGGYDFYEKIK